MVWLLIGIDPCPFSDAVPMDCRVTNIGRDRGLSRVTHAYQVDVVTVATDSLMLEAPVVARVSYRGALETFKVVQVFTWWCCILLIACSCHTQTSFDCATIVEAAQLFRDSSRSLSLFPTHVIQSLDLSSLFASGDRIQVQVSAYFGNKSYPSEFLADSCKVCQVSSHGT